MTEHPAAAGEFAGSGGGYFRTWAMDLLPTLLTLGLYSAWARGRREAYFLGHTRLAGTPFIYRPDAGASLKGRLAAAALLAASLAGSQLAPLPGLLLGLAALGGLLWLAFRSLRFHIDRLSHGGEPLRCEPRPRDFLFAWLGGALLLAVPLAVAGLLLEATTPDSGDARLAAGYLLALAGPPVALLLLLFLVRPFLRVQLANLAWNAARRGEARFASRQDLGSYWPLYAGNLLLTVLSLGFYRPWALAREAAYRASHLSLVES